MNSIRHGRELGQPRVRRHRLSIAGGGTPLPPQGLTVGDIGWPGFGFEINNAGDLQPPTVSGSTVNTVAAYEDAGNQKLDINFANGEAPGNVVDIVVNFPGFGGPFTLPYTNGWFSLVVPGVVDYFAANLGKTIPISIELGQQASQPAISNNPLLVVSQDGLSLIYTAGIWNGAPAPAIDARLEITGVTMIPVDGSATIPIQEAWKGRTARITEIATNNSGVGQAFSDFVNIPGGQTLDQQIEAMLAGTQGCVWDPQDLSTLSQSHNSDVPVTGPGQQIGRMRSKFGAGGVRTMQQSTTTARGLLQADGTILLDGIDDALTGGLGFLNVPVITLAALFVPNAAGLSGDDAVLFSQIAGTGSTNERVLMRLANGVPVLTCRRLDLDPLTTVQSPTPVVADAISTMLASMDFATGSPFARLRVNNVQVGESSISGTPGNTENTTPGRQGYGTRHTTMRFSGKIGRVFYAPFLLTLSQMSVVESWLREPP